MAYGRSIPCDLTRESWSDRARQRPTLSGVSREEEPGTEVPGLDAERAGHL